MPKTNEMTIRRIEPSIRDVTDFFDQGMQSIMKEDWNQAIIYFCRVLESDPTSVESFNNLGLAFKNIGQLDNAEACLRKAIEYDPSSFNAYYNLGLIYYEERYLDDAEFCFRHALQLNPNNPDLYNTLGVVLEHASRLSEAENEYKQAIALKADYGIAHYNLGGLYKITQRFDKAEEHLRYAHELCPNEHNFALGLAFYYLLLGNFELGWKKYADALLPSAIEYPESNVREWRGEDLAGKRILLYAGKGLGDTLQFIRYAPMVEALGAHISIWVQEPLQRLLAAHYHPMILGIEEKAWSDHYDYFCSLQTLPIYFNSTEKTIPRYSHYLSALPEDSTLWQQRLTEWDGDKCYRVGVVWSGNIDNPMDNFRSIPFVIFNELLINTDEIKWISLQTGSRAEDYKDVTEILLDVSPHLTDFGQTAAIVQHLDLVITMDTSVAHLAGAVGQKTWLLLDVNSEWRWHLDREDTPWYPSMRLFRQCEAGNWSEVLARVTVALQQELLMLNS